MREFLASVGEFILDVIAPGIVIVVGLLTAGALFLAIPIRQISHHYDVAKCRTFAQQTGYETKFADYNIVEWDCLARTASGKWVSISQLREVD